MAVQQHTSTPAHTRQFLRDLGVQIHRDQRRIAADLRQLLRKRRSDRALFLRVLQAEIDALED